MFNFHCETRSRTYVKDSKKSGTSKRTVDQKLRLKAARSIARQFGLPHGPSSYGPNIGMPFARSKPETNSLDLLIAETNILCTGTIVLLNSIAAGDDINMRDGREVRLKSVEVRGMFRPTHASAAALPHQFLRALLIYDNAPTGALPAVIDMLSDTASTAFSAANPAPYSFNNLNNRKRFKVVGVVEDVWGQTPASNTEIENCTQVSMYRKLNYTQTFSSASAGIGAITSGALYLVLLSTQDTAAPNMIVFEGRSRVRFQG